MMGLVYPSTASGRSRRRIWTPDQGITRPSCWLDASRRDTLITVATATGVNTSGSASAGTSSITTASTLVGQVVVGMVVTFGADTVEYSVTSINATTIVVTPVLDSTVPNATAINCLHVSDWADVSGNGLSAAQTTSGNRPVFGDRALNGMPAVYGMGDTYTRHMTLALAANPYSIFAAMSANGNGTLIGNATNNNNLQIRTLSNTVQILKQNVVNYLAGTFTYTNDVPFVMSIITANGDNRAAINGSYDTNTTATTITGATGNIFKRAAATPNYFSGRLGELLVYYSIQKDSEIQKIEAYLSHKWGAVATLISSSSYKQRPPVS